MEKSYNWLDNFLICPVCKQDLSRDEKALSLSCKACNQKYEIIELVPVLLPAIRTGSETSEESFNYYEHYSKDAEIFDYFELRHGATADDERRVHEYITSIIPVKPNTVLDVGCGRAWLARDLNSKGIFVCSMDISVANPAKAIKKYSSAYHSSLVADAFFLPFRDNSFDCIVASEIIEHVNAPDDFVKELFRCLKSGGTLIISTPYKEVLQYSLCVHCNQKTPHNAHLHSFDENILRVLYQGEDLKAFEWKVFGNKILLHLRTYILLKYFPFGIWKLIDKFFNLLHNKPAHIIVKFVKR